MQKKVLSPEEREKRMSEILKAFKTTPQHKALQHKKVEFKKGRVSTEAFPETKEQKDKYQARFKRAWND
jgi:hypothetical protein